MSQSGSVKFLEQLATFIPRAASKEEPVSIGNFVKVIYWVLVPCNKIVAIRSVSCAVAQFRASNESLGGGKSCGESSIR